MNQTTPAPTLSLRLPLGSWWLLPVSILLFALTLTVGFTAKSWGRLSPDLAWDIAMSEDRSTVLDALALGVHYILGPTGAVLILETGHSSFPSGHTAFAASLAWAVILVLARSRRMGILTAVLGSLFAVGVGLSRLYLGVHYPTDVLGSLLISTAGILFWLPLWTNVIEPPVSRLGLISRLAVPAQPRTAGI